MLTTVAAGRVYDFNYCIGMYAGAGQGFWAPQDFVLGPNEIVYVVSRGQEELGQRITRVSLNHDFLGQFGGFGYGDGQFVWPRSLDMDQENLLYVSDELTHRITKFDTEGAYQGHWGEPGDGEGQLNGPSGLAFDKDDNLYVVDSLNHRVQLFTKDGKFLTMWGGHGTADGQFDLPWGICVDRNGDVYVADWQNSRVQKFSPNGQFLRKFEATENGVGPIERPCGVAVDSDGDVYVTDWRTHKVQIYGPDGTFVTSLVGDAQEPSPWTQTYVAANPDMVKARRRANMEPEWRFRRPTAVNVDDQDRIFVLESARARLQVYNKDKDYEEPPINL
jgi:DNA-binding beta-propeller fold protein YncE